MKNFFDHEQKVKYIDGVLAKSQDWDWLIEYIENNFEVDFSLTAFSDFMKVFSKISDIFRYFNSINEYFEDKFNISKQWLYQINELSLYYLGKKNYDELDLNNDFLKIFELLIYLAKLNNETNDNKFIIFTDIIQFRNLYKLFDISNFIREESDILNRLNSVSIDTSKEISIFEGNINKEFFDCSAILNENTDKIISANCFSYQHLSEISCNTWEEKYLLDMLNTSYEEGDLIPSIKYTNGKTMPDFNLWTEEVISTMINDFANEDANFILESINYILYKVIPSETVIFKHANLLLKYYEKINNTEDEYKNYSCSSLEMLITLFNDKSISTNPDLITLYNKALRKIDNIQKLIEIDSKCPIRDKNLKKQINEYIIKKLDNVNNIKTFYDFESFISDPDIMHKSNNEVFQKVSDAFDECIVECDGIEVSHIFLSYLHYLLKIKKNRNITAGEISKEIIYIRHLWKEEFLNKSISNMKKVSHQVQIKNEMILAHNKTVIENPYAIAYSCMILREESIIQSIADIAEHPLTLLVSHISINDDFPCIPTVIIDERHEIDLLYKGIIDKIKTEKSYKFRNDLKTDELLLGIYEKIKANIRINFAMFHNTKELYNKIKEDNKDYLILEYSETPTLAHLTQLFPMLECRIRDIGELFGIAPIREDLLHITKLKDPTTVLKKIINETIDFQNDRYSLVFAKFLHTLLLWNLSKKSFL